MSAVYMVEDDENIRELVLYALAAAGFAARGFEDGEQLFTQLAHNADPPSLILLDIMLPGEDGLTILKRLRVGPYKHIPVIMLTAKGSEFDRVKGLDLGADDYIVKPFGVTELISRIKAVLRRAEPVTSAGGALTYQGIMLDPQRRTVKAEGQQILLTYKEYELLHYLLLNANIVLSRDKIMDAVWGYDFGGESRTVDMHIKTLRHKLGPAGQHIKTVRNVGYKIGD